MRQKKEVIQSIETLLKQVKKCVNLDELYQELQKFKKMSWNNDQCRFFIFIAILVCWAVYSRNCNFCIYK